MTSWALLVEYDGTPFNGWQRQGALPTVQSVLEAAAANLAGAPVVAHVAGRTDAGVHATGQVAMLDLPDRFEARAVEGALNFHMKPHPVVVLRAARALPGWHPRFSALRRSYLYRILNRPARPALLSGRAWHVWPRLDHHAMADAAHSLLGRHDFSSFRAAACQANSPLRTLDVLDVSRHEDAVEIRAEARSFLHHQVRNMVGTLRLVGAGQWRPGRVRDALDARDRSAAGPTAPPDGLFLTGVSYEPNPFAAPGG